MRNPRIAQDWVSRTGGKVQVDAEEIVAELKKLQTEGRLLVHRFEARDKYETFPAHTRRVLRRNTPYFEGPLKEKLLKGDVSLLSMSMLPDENQKQWLLPYDMDLWGNTPMYLFSLDGKSSGNPALAVRVSENGLGSGGKSVRKHFKLCEASQVPALKALYKPYDPLDPDRGYEEVRRIVKEQQLINDVFNNPSMSTQALDGLSDYYRASKSGVQPMNEILVAATQEHIVAIGVPMMLHAGSPVKREIRYAVGQLAGALTGLAHALKGVELPVVWYHGDEHQSGSIKGLANGEQKCRAIAMEAAQSLQRNPDLKKPFRMLMPSGDEVSVCAETSPGMIALHRHAQEMLGVDIFAAPINRGKVGVYER